MAGLVGYELWFREDIKPHRCLIRGCTNTAELWPKAQRESAFPSVPRIHRPGDSVMNQAEWEFWSGENFGSYCAKHKCVKDGCDMGMRFDETGSLFNMCAYHCHWLALEAMAKEEKAKRRSRLSGVFSRVAGKVSVAIKVPGPELRVHGRIPPAHDRGGLRRLHAMCTVGTCKRLQILDSRGMGGACELCTEFPVLPEGVAMGPNGAMPPLARVLGVDGMGQYLEVLQMMNRLELAQAGSQLIASNVLNLVTAFGG
jgi:hypothetical protein